ncbi:MAG: hypothetical protein RBU25_02260 [Lentisphaeria bacterium]|jgi:negative regulator of sigma E activity|nr:hypothetical protein [Lentisphaeria bacterium]
MSELVEQTGCPPFESLSAYVDGEATEAEIQHIKSCENCLRVVSSLRSLDAVVSRSCQPPEGLADRIIAACNSGASQSSPRVVPFWGRSLLRYAAALAVTAALALAIRQAVGTVNQDGQPGNLIAGTEEIQTEPAGNPGGAPIGPNQIRTVATQNATAGTGGAAIAKRPLAAEVNHVWGVRNLAAVEKQLESQLPKEVNWGMTRDSNGTQIFQASLTDEQLQQLVNGIHRQGYDLFSSELPQPNQEDRVTFANSRRVIYHARFVQLTEQ